MKDYNEAVLEVEEFILNADIADASNSTEVGHGGGEGTIPGIGGNGTGVEFEINDEI